MLSVWVHRAPNDPFRRFLARAGEEAADQMARHDPMMVLKGTTFVQYSHAISNQMEGAYQAFKGQGVFPKDV